MLSHIFVGSVCLAAGYLVCVLQCLSQAIEQDDGPRDIDAYDDLQ